MKRVTISEHLSEVGTVEHPVASYSGLVDSVIARGYKPKDARQIAYHASQYIEHPDDSEEISMQLIEVGVSEKNAEVIRRLAARTLRIRGMRVSEAKAVDQKILGSFTALIAKQIGLHTDEDQKAVINDTNLILQQSNTNNGEWTTQQLPYGNSDIRINRASYMADLYTEWSLEQSLAKGEKRDIQSQVVEGMFLFDEDVVNKQKIINGTLKVLENGPENEHIVDRILSLDGYSKDNINDVYKLVHAYHDFTETLIPREGSELAVESLRIFAQARRIGGNEQKIITAAEIALQQGPENDCVVDTMLTSDNNYSEDEMEQVHDLVYLYRKWDAERQTIMKSWEERIS